MLFPVLLLLNLSVSFSVFVALNLLLPGFFALMVKRLLFTCLIFLFAANSSVFAQLTPQGAQVIFGTATTIGREIKRTSDENKARKEQEEADANYNDLVLFADDLFAKGNFTEAKTRYSEALRVKREQYVVDQIARCDAEIARANRSQYQVLVDSGDSLLAVMEYDKAIEKYNAALAINNQKYAADRLAEAKAYKEMWTKVMFSGLMVLDMRQDDFSSKAYVKDPFSDYMKAGKYPSIDAALIYSSFKTLDGIAVPPGARIIIYSEQNYKGKVVLDATGPMIINNIAKNTSSEAGEWQTRLFDGRLESVFPASTRFWSQSDMNQWVMGSMIITNE